MADISFCENIKLQLAYGILVGGGYGDGEVYDGVNDRLSSQSM